MRRSIRTLATVSSAGFAVLALIVVAMLIWASSLLQRDTASAIRDTRSMAFTSELERTLLMYQRMSNLFVLNGDAQLRSARDEMAVEMRRLLGEAHAYVGSIEEKELLARIEKQLNAYIRDRERIETQPIELSEVIRRSVPSFNETLLLMDSLREINEAEVQQAHARAIRVDRLSNLTGAAAGLLLLIGSLVFALGVRRYVLRPMLDLHEAIARFRAGEAHVKVEEGPSREAAELARAFNEMIDALVLQRDDQIASLAGVAHELRNPLSALKLGVHALEPEQSEAQRARTLTMLNRQIDHLLRMLNDLVDTTRVEAGNLPMRLEDIDLRVAVERVVQLYAPTSPEHEFVVDAPESPVRIHGDPLRIEQLVSNLVSNAVKFSPRGSRIDVSVGEVEGCSVMSVTDRGVGIPAHDVPKLFAPFRRNRPDIAPGAGLGLSVVRRIVSAHGGEIEVESTPESGSTFRVSIPSARPPEDERGKSLQSQAASSSPHSWPSRDSW